MHSKSDFSNLFGLVRLFEAISLPCLALCRSIEPTWAARFTSFDRPAEAYLVRHGSARHHKWRY